MLKALSQIIDPDFGTDIVSCGFVKDLGINEALGEVIIILYPSPICSVLDCLFKAAETCLVSCCRFRSVWS